MDKELQSSFHALKESEISICEENIRARPSGETFSGMRILGREELEELS